MADQNTPPASLPPAASTSLNPPAPAPAVEMYDLSGAVKVSTDQVHMMAKDMIRLGHVPNIEAANQLLAREGLAPIPPPEPYKSPEQIGFEKTYAPARPQDFSMPRVTPGENAAAHLANQDTVRSWLGEMQLPTSLGNSVIEIARQTHSQIDSIESQSDFNLWRDNEKKNLTRVWGPEDGEKFKANTALVQKFVDTIEAKKPGFKDYLNKSGVGNSTLLTETLRQHAERLAAHKGGF